MQAERCRRQIQRGEHTAATALVGRRETGPGMLSWQGGSARGLIKHNVYPGVAQLVARVVWDHDAAGSNPVTRTIRSVLKGFEDTPYYFLLRGPFKGVAYSYSLSCFYNNVCFGDVLCARHSKLTNAVVMDNNALAVYAFGLFCLVNIYVVN